MTDRESRTLERAAAEGDLHAYARLLNERVRRGDLAEDRLLLAAGLGHEAARLAREVALLIDWKDDATRRAVLGGLSREERAGLAIDFASHVLAIFERARRDDRRLREAIIYARDCATRPPVVATAVATESWPFPATAAASAVQPAASSAALAAGAALAASRDASTGNASSAAELAADAVGRAAEAGIDNVWVCASAWAAASGAERAWQKARVAAVALGEPVEAMNP